MEAARLRQKRGWRCTAQNDRRACTSCAAWHRRRQLRTAYQVRSCSYNSQTSSREQAGSCLVMQLPRYKELVINLACCCKEWR